MSATYLAPFELRRLLVKFGRAPAGGTIEDAAVFSVHFAKLTGGAPDANWLAADYAAVEARFDTLWTTLRPYHAPITVLSEYRWYKDGPVFAPDDLAPGPANPAARITARAVAGTVAATNQLPPQCAVTVTKIVPERKRWGRLYLPAPVVTYATTEGRLSSGALATWLAAFVTCLNGCRTDGKQPVVFSRGRSAYVTRRGTAVAAHAASAYEITDVQMDNLYDVIRTRRWTAATVKTRTALT